MTPPTTTSATSPPAPVAASPARRAEPFEPVPVGGHATPGFRSVVLWERGRHRVARVSTDRWVTVEEAARILGRRTADVRERVRDAGLVAVGDGRPGSPRRYRLRDVCPEVLVSARPGPSPPLPGASG